MATRLQEFPTEGRGRYDWDKWLDGSVWQLKAGEDYRTTDGSMRGYIYKMAAHRGKSVRVSQVAPGVLVLRAEEREV